MKSVLVALMLVLMALGPGRASMALAQGDSCIDLCAATCIKPWAIPDRWDDVTGIPGYMGEGVGRIRRPEWRNNDRWDTESFVDTNGNGTWEEGESFVDGNANGLHDQESFHSSLTGYIARPVPGNLLSPDGDLGLELILHYSTLSSPNPGGYVAFSLPPINKGTPVAGGAAYRENIRVCNAALVEPADWLQVEAGGMIGPTNLGMRDLIAQDPDAYWDSSTGSVQGSDFGLSPRVIFVPAYDPSLPFSPTNGLKVTKIIAFFMEQMTGPAEVRGRFFRAFAPGVPLGSPCSEGQVGGFIVDCPVPATPATWGRVKDTYR